MKYRLYIDEVGNASMNNASGDTNDRYLSLTGVAMELGYVDSTVAPALETLKRRYFRTHVDEPIIFHRKELAGRLYPFKALMDPEIQKSFNADLLSLLRDLNYTIFTAVIDKVKHKEQYKVWQYDPYHYCLLILVERFVMWMEKQPDQEAVGDVLAEARGGKEDRRLKDSFGRVYENGSAWVSAARIQERLTSKQLKVKTKNNNIAGLQLADLIAHPSFKAALARRNGQSLPDNFGGRIAAILEESKFDRSPRGSIEGYGRKWLP
jgi:hypothetical protein